MLLQLVVGMNLFGTVYTVNAVAPTMKAQRSGKIITVSSVAGTAPSADGGYAHYGGIPVHIRLVWPPDNRSAPIGSNASRSIDPFGASDLSGGWLADSHSPIGTGASRSVDPLSADDSLRRLGKRERTKCDHDGERNVFHLKK